MFANRHPVEDVCQPAPRVVASRQPWALRRNPVGILGKYAGTMDQVSSRFSPLGEWISRSRDAATEWLAAIPGRPRPACPRREWLANPDPYLHKPNTTPEEPQCAGPLPKKCRVRASD